MLLQGTSGAVLPQATALLHSVNRLPIVSDFAKVNSVLAVTYGLSSKIPMLSEYMTTLSFVVSALVASASSISVSEKAEHLAWKVLLQASLVLSIIGRDKTAGIQTDEERGTMDTVAPSMLVAFLIGSVGSLIGGLLSYKLVTTFFPKAFPVRIVNMVSSCLTASYIGGSANFFEVANLLKTDSATERHVVNQICASDIGIMILYFELLAVLRRWTFTNRLFPRSSSPSVNEVSSTAQKSVYDAIAQQEVSTDRIANEEQSNLVDRLQSGVMMTSQLLFAFYATSLTAKCQDVITVPGISVALSTFLALGVDKVRV